MAATQVTPLPEDAQRHNLPNQLTSFVGREQEVPSWSDS